MNVFHSITKNLTPMFEWFINLSPSFLMLTNYLDKHNYMPILKTSATLLFNILIVCQLLYYKFGKKEMFVCEPIHQKIIFAAINVCVYLFLVIYGFITHKDKKDDECECD